MNETKPPARLSWLDEGLDLNQARRAWGLPVIGFGLPVIGPKMTDPSPHITSTITGDVW